MSDKSEWGVWENSAGVFWTVTPPTKENAEHEAKLCGRGHEPMPSANRSMLQNAFAAGRLHGHAQVRAWSSSTTMGQRTAWEDNRDA